MTKDKFYPHIDGLRAIAVIAVILFHLDIAILSGGFLGVDIFFVISGYLITSHLTNAIESDRFNLFEFYNRRARRILPALLTVIVVTLLAGLILLGPRYVTLLGEEAISACLGLSNFYYWLNSGYFDAGSEVKPLLHTWSLGVELQFYLLWPLLLLIFFKIWRYFILSIAICSLLACEWAMNKDVDAAFYLLPFRIFEFCIGALAFYFAAYKPTQITREKISFIGLALTVFPLFIFDSTSHFPGIGALLSCLGVALIIHSGEGTSVQRILSVKPAIWIGALSYSLYLVHWPLIVIYKHSIGEPNGILVITLLLAGTFILASILFYFIEKPFRKRNETFLVSISGVYGFTLVCMALVGCVFVAIKQTDGTLWKQGKNLSNLDFETGMSSRLSLLNKTCGERGWDKCYEPSQNKRNVMVLGNSHALDGFNTLLMAYPDNHYYLNALPGGCPPFIETDENIIKPDNPDRPHCLEFNRNLFTEASFKNVDVVVISALIFKYRAEHIFRAVERINQITKGNVRVIVFGSYMGLKRDMLDLLNNEIDPRLERKYLTVFAPDEQLLRNGATKYNYTFISQKELLCEGEQIQSCPLMFGDEPFTYDKNHLSFSTAKAMADKLRATKPHLFE